MEFSYEIRIPKERVAVLIGKNGRMKADLAKTGKLKIDIDSNEGLVTLTGEDSLQVFNIKQIVQAIGRGFNPELAMLLLRTDYNIEFLNLTDFGGQNQFERLKGRVIGAKGKSQKTIESLTECYISVYGKTIGIIGATEHALIAKKAVEMLLQGSMHRSVYSMLETWRRRKKPVF